MYGPILDRRLVDFLMIDWLGVADLFDRPRFADHSPETIGAVVDLASRIAENEFLPCYQTGDRNEPELHPDGVRIDPDVAAAVRSFCAAGLSSGPFDADLDGMQLPETVHAVVMAHFMAANLGASAYPMLSIANARLIAAFGSPAQVDRFARPQIAGAMLGTMCLSEPQAGSSLADITTRAVADGEDAAGPRYRLTGNKMWISGGDHDITRDIVHLVLAKIPEADGSLPAGTAGISLFAVPRRVDLDGAAVHNDITVAGLNHKMGYRATSNCLLNLGEGTVHRPGGRSGAIGYRIGEPGRGLAQMFRMMNEARIAIGLGAAAVGCRSHALSVAYALDRRQGRPTGRRGGDPVAIIGHPDVRRMLLAQKAYAELALALVLYCARLVDETHTAADAGAREDAQRCLDVLTPVAKTWASDFGLAACDIAIQVHGGYGYTRDFAVEQLYRDSRLNPIHEGTTGIQAIDLVGRKVLRDGGEGLAALGRRLLATCGSAREAGLAGHAADLERAWDDVVGAAGHLGRLEGDAPYWHATDFLAAMGHVVVAWLGLDQAVCASAAASDDPFRAARLRVCRYFFEAELPRAGVWLRTVTSGSDVAAAAPLETFTG